jgi:hypothetical protein
MSEPLQHLQATGHHEHGDIQAPTIKKVLSQLSASKDMETVFWLTVEVIHVKFLQS